MWKKMLIILVLFCSLLLVACQNEPKMDISEASDEMAVEVHGLEEKEVKVDLINREGVSVGMATVTEADKGVHIFVDAHHLPVGSHGFHIHEKGVCEPPNFESAGGHFNPGDDTHGFENKDGPHAGDLINLEVGEDGIAKGEFTNDMVTLKKGVPNSLLHEGGTSLVIHADPDDYISQPAGNAGERIVCGVIND